MYVSNEVLIDGVKEVSLNGTTPKDIKEAEEKVPECTFD